MSEGYPSTHFRAAFSSWWLTPRPVSISTGKPPLLYGLFSVTDIGCKPFVYLLRLIDLYHTIFTVGEYRRIEPLSILPQYADSKSTLSVNLTVEDLGRLETLIEISRFYFNEQVTAFVRISFGLRYRLQVFCEFVTLDWPIPYLSLR